MPDIFIGVDEPVPTDYSPAPATLNDADWYIDGHRYRETGRTPTEGGYTMTLERSDTPKPLGYTIERPES